MDIISRIEHTSSPAVIEELEREIDAVLKDGMKALIADCDTDDEILDCMWNKFLECRDQENYLKSELDRVIHRLSEIIKLVNSK